MIDKIYLIVGTVYYADTMGENPPVFYGIYDNKKRAELAYSELMSQRNHLYSDNNPYVYPEPKRSDFDSETIQIYEQELTYGIDEIVYNGENLIDVVNMLHKHDIAYNIEQYNTGLKIESIINIESPHYLCIQNGNTIKINNNKTLTCLINPK